MFGVPGEQQPYADFLFREDKSLGERGKQDIIPVIGDIPFVSYFFCVVLHLVTNKKNYYVTEKEYS